MVRSSWLWIVVALFSVVAFGCKKKPSFRYRIRAKHGQIVLSFDTQVIAGAAGAGSRYAAGTHLGGIIVASSDGRQRRFADDIGHRTRASNAPENGGQKKDGAPKTKATIRAPMEPSSIDKPATPAASALAKRKLAASHDGAISALEFSTTGDRLLSAGGRSVSWWNVETAAPIRWLRGPQIITAATLADDDASAFFSTSRGHMLRWSLDKKVAEAVKNFACRPSAVAPERMKMPVAKRCRGGHFRVVKGKQICLYAVTHIKRRGALVARGCREGTVGVINPATRKLYWSNLAGVLRALDFVDDQRLLFAREDGQLRVWDLQQKRIVMSYLPPSRADAATAGSALVAVAQGKRVRIWQRDQAQVAGALKLPERAVWLRIVDKPLRLELLLRDGRLVAHPLEVKKVAAQ